MLTKNKSIIICIFLFIIYKFYLIILLFRERLLLPLPDDSYFYLTETKKIIDSKTVLYNFPPNAIWPTDWLQMLPYKLFLIFIHFISGLSLEKVYIASFFVGTIILPFVLLYFFKKLTKDKLNIAWLILFMAFYSGSGAYHGFYWVVPSFFALLLFFLIISTKQKIINLLLVVVFVFLNPMSVFVLLIPVFYSIFLYIFSKKEYKNILNYLVLLVWGFFVYGIGFLILKITHTAVRVNYDLPIDSIKNILNGGNFYPGWSVFQNEYLKILFPKNVFIPVFFVLIYILFKNKRFKMLSLFFATLVFTLCSLINKTGYRALEFQWPLTFMLVGQGIYDLFRFLKIIPKTIFAIMVLGFLFMLNTFNMIQVKRLNIEDDYLIDSSCSLYLMQMTSLKEIICFDSNGIYQYFNYLGLYKRRAILIDSVTFKQNISADKKYLVRRKSKIIEKEENLSSIEKLLVSQISRKNIIDNKASVFWDNSAPMKLVKDCGQFAIYNMISSR